MACRFDAFRILVEININPINAAFDILNLRFCTLRANYYMNIVSVSAHFVRSGDDVI